MRGLLSVVAPVVAGLGILWPTVLPAQRVRSPANIIIVTNTNDSGPGSFRQALADVEDGDTIQFDSALNRSEEHTSELQSPDHLVCRLLLEKKKKKIIQYIHKKKKKKKKKKKTK